MTDTPLHTGPRDDPTRYWVSLEDIERVEVGGEGLVYRAHHTGTGRIVALKMLTGVAVADCERVVERSGVFVGIDHPNLMEQLEVFLGTALTDRRPDAVPTDDFDVVYSVSAWIDGMPLVEAAAGASAQTKIRWITDVAAALTCLHLTRHVTVPHGIVHRDIKPSNVRIRDDGTAVVLDFGVARPVDPTDMTEGVGTYLWRAPEVLTGSNGRVGVRTDIWALGALAHWLFVGEPPQLDGAAAARERIDIAVRDAGLADPAAVARHIAELLHSTPAQRPDDLRQWTTELLRLAGRRRPQGRPMRVTIGSLLALALLTLTTTGSGASPASRYPTPESSDSRSPAPSSEYLMFPESELTTIRRNVTPAPSYFEFSRGRDGHRPLQVYLASSGEVAGAVAPVDTIVETKVTDVTQFGQVRAYGLSVGGRPWRMAVINYGAMNLPVAEFQVEAEAFLAELDFDGDQPTAGPDFTPVPSFLHDGRPMWSIGQGSTTLTAYQDTATDVADIPGTATEVRRREAVVSRIATTWREAEDLIIVMSFPVDDANSISDSKAWLAGRRALADGLIEGTPADYKRLPLDNQANVAVVVTAPHEQWERGLSVAFLTSNEADAALDTLGIGSEGSIVYQPLDGATTRPTAMKIWANADAPPPGTLQWAGTPPGWAMPQMTPGAAAFIPSCAQEVRYPSVGEPPVEVALDMTCSA